VFSSGHLPYSLSSSRSPDVNFSDVKLINNYCKSLQSGYRSSPSNGSNIKKSSPPIFKICHPFTDSRKTLNPQSRMFIIKFKNIQVFSPTY
jgi:hypothetical protein